MSRWVGRKRLAAADMYGTEQMRGVPRRRLVPVNSAFVVSMSSEDTGITTTLVRAPFNR